MTDPANSGRPTGAPERCSSAPAAEPPLSPSALLKNQKLRSKHHFLSPQFDTSCLPSSSTESADDPIQPESPSHPHPVIYEPDAQSAGPSSAPTQLSLVRSYSRSQSELNGGSRSSNYALNTSVPPANSIKYRNLGKSGLKIPTLVLGIWHSYSAQLSEQSAEHLIKSAFACGINFFDTGDAFNGGRSELLLGNVLKRQQWPRNEFIVCTKLFWNQPNTNNNRQPSGSLSRKFLIEALQASLQRLQLSYVDLVLVNRLDGRCPMEEIVRTMHWLVERGYALYWGTSRWSAAHLAEAFSVARQFNCIPPACEQMEYSMGCARRKCETAMSELYHRLGVGVLSWSVGSLDADSGISLISRRSITEYQTYGPLGAPEAPASTEVDAANTMPDNGSGGELSGDVPRTPLPSGKNSTETSSADQRKLSGVSMKLSRKSSTMDKKKMSNVERQLMESANLNVDRLNGEHRLVVDRLGVDRLSVDRLSTSSALTTPEKSPHSSRRRLVDRTLSGSSVGAAGDRINSLCGSDNGRIVPDEQSERQARFDTLCNSLGCDATQFSIAWSLRNEHVNSVLISPKTVEQLYAQINSLKFTFQMKPAITDELEKILNTTKSESRKESVAPAGSPVETTNSGDASQPQSSKQTVV